MRQYGFKLFSSNLHNATTMVDECAKFAKEQTDMFIELMVVSSSTKEDLLRLKDIFAGLEVRIHSAHHGEGFDAGNKDLEQQNIQLLKKSQDAADIFNSPTIIVHAGCGHDFEHIQETARQFKLFNDQRILVENLPRFSFKKLPFHGNTAEDIKYIMDESGCGFCLDFSHAVSAARYFNLDADEVLSAFNALHPKMYHICDGFLEQAYDVHEHFGDGNYPLEHYLNNYTDENSYITMETGHDLEEHNTRWVKDYNYLKALVKNI